MERVNWHKGINVSILPWTGKTAPIDYVYMYTVCNAITIKAIQRCQKEIVLDGG